MTETQPGREPEQGAGPENEIREQAEYRMGYADPSAQRGLGTREPTDDLSPTGYLDPSGHSGLGSREPTEAHEVLEGLREAGSNETAGT